MKTFITCCIILGEELEQIKNTEDYGVEEYTRGAVSTIDFQENRASTMNTSSH